MNVTSPQGPAQLDASNMTQAQAIAALKGNLAARGATVTDTAVVYENDPSAEPLEENPNGGEAEDSTGEVEAGSETADTNEADPESKSDETLLVSGLIQLPDGSRVSVEEATKGYLRVQDYHKGQRELAQLRQNITAQGQAEAQEVKAILQNMRAFQEAEPDWAQVATQYEPSQVLQMQANWKKRETETRRASEFVQRQQQAQANAEKVAARQTLASGEYNPDWKDPKKLDAGLGKIMDYALDHGYEPQRLKAISNPVTLIMLDKARKWDELNASKPVVQKSLSGKPTAIPKPGTKAVNAQSEQVRGLTEAYGKNPTQANALALFKAKHAR